MLACTSKAIKTKWTSCAFHYSVSHNAKIAWRVAVVWVELEQQPPHRDCAKHIAQRLTWGKLPFWICTNLFVALCWTSTTWLTLSLLLPDSACCQLNWSLWDAIFVLVSVLFTQTVLWCLLNMSQHDFCKQSGVCQCLLYWRPSSLMLQVFELDLSNNDLSGPLPSSLSSLTYEWASYCCHTCNWLCLADCAWLYLLLKLSNTSWYVQNVMAVNVWSQGANWLDLLASVQWTRLQCCIVFWLACKT